jgi:Activator of Hsp90 ATPase homolog 1-like protein
MTTTTQATTQVYRIYIKATPEAIWDTITKPEWTARYGYTGLASYDLRPGGAYSVAPTPEFKEHLGHLRRGCHGDLVSADVVRVTVPAVRPVAHHHLRPDFPQHFDQLPGLLGQVATSEGSRMHPSWSTCPTVGATTATVPNSQLASQRRIRSSHSPSSTPAAASVSRSSASFSFLRKG